MNPEKAPVILTFENFKEKKWSTKKLLHSLKWATDEQDTFIINTYTSNNVPWKYIKDYLTKQEEIINKNFGLKILSHSSQKM